MPNAVNDEKNFRNDDKTVLFTVIRSSKLVVIFCLVLLERQSEGKSKVVKGLKGRERKKERKREREKERKR